MSDDASGRRDVLVRIGFGAGVVAYRILQMGKTMDAA